VKKKIKVTLKKIIDHGFIRIAEGFSVSVERRMLPDFQELFEATVLPHQ
jgi:hypothetical protein